MEFRSLIVCLDDADSSRERLGFALALAVRHNARLTGLHLSYMPSAAFAASDGVEQLYATLEQELLARQAAAREDFLAEARHHNVPADFIAARNRDIAAVTAHARVCDLVIAGQPDPGDTTAPLGGGFSSRFVLELGRPVLLLPHGFPAQADFGHVMVAWNGSRESTRALFDALPLLQAAQRVTVLTMRGEDSHWPGGGPVPPPDLPALLLRHGIDARLLENGGREEPGAWLLARATDLDDPADLLVAGAYGHSRLSEFVLGGVTRTLLGQMTLPLLLSH